jgi:Uma2 family endonuclease
MAAILEKSEIKPVELLFPKELPLDDKTLLALSLANPDLQLERNAKGELIVMSPAGGKSSRRNAELVYQLMAWAKKDGTDTVFDSSGGFSLSNGAVRAPDACWVSNEQLAKLTDEELEAFPPLCPEFVIELRSATDPLKTLQEKMKEYIANGTILGWLLDAKTQNVYVYTPDGVTLLEAPEKVKGTGRLESFELDLLEVC